MKQAQSHNQSILCWVNKLCTITQTQSQANPSYDGIIGYKGDVHKWCTSKIPLELHASQSISMSLGSTIPPPHNTKNVPFTPQQSLKSHLPLGTVQCVHRNTTQTRSYTQRTQPPLVSLARFALYTTLVFNSTWSLCTKDSQPTNRDKQLNLVGHKNYRHLMQTQLAWGMHYLPHTTPRRYPFTIQQSLKRHIPPHPIKCVHRKNTQTPYHLSRGSFLINITSQMHTTKKLLIFISNLFLVTTLFTCL